MVSRVRCLVRYITWWALLLFVLAMDGISDGLSLCGSGRISVGRYAPLLLGLSDRAASQLVVPIGLLGSFVLWTALLFLIN